MRQNDYFREDRFSLEHGQGSTTPESPSTELEETIAAKTKPECFEEVSTKVPFCCAVNVPQGFKYVPNGSHRFAYTLDCLSVIEEKCRKTFEVDECGPVEVTLNLLKVVGCIPYIANATVEGECGSNCDYDQKGKHQISVCCTDSLCVDNVLKCSLECLPHYKINCHNVVVSDFTVQPLQDQGCELLKFTGTIEFKHIPFS